MSDLPKAIYINEDGAREGFQFEKGPISVERKIELIDALSETGIRDIVVCSFVPAKNVPGMADADTIVQRFKKQPGVRYTGLWFNEKGLARALQTDRLEVRGRISLTASEAFLKSNLRCTWEESIRISHNMMDMLKEHDVPVEMGSMMAAFGCNFQGDISTQRVLDVVAQVLDIADEHGHRIKVFNFADTMAWATPESIRTVLGAVREKYPEMKLSLHLHDTRGMGIANAYAGLQMGVEYFDSSVAGLGGCPFAAHKGAAGNVCTEDLVFMCEEMGIHTGIDLDRLIEVGQLAEDIVGHPLPGAVKNGGSLRRLREKLAPAK